ncbi:MAG TPA: hypothetical protein VNQ73_08280 [Ilumatobacter sp.]|nr:hypothetical protein [Ilumatobacter sp.]
MATATASIALRRRPITSTTAEVIGQYVALSGAEHRDHWKYLSALLDAAGAGGTVLGITHGTGELLNLLSAVGRFNEVHGWDASPFADAAVSAPDVTLHRASPFPGLQFDVVILEVPASEGISLTARLAEVRQHCRQRLIIAASAPHDGWTEDGMRALSPLGALTWLESPDARWLLAIEDLGAIRSFCTSEVDRLRLRTEQLEQQVAGLRQELRRLESRKAIRFANRVGRWRRQLARSRRQSE